MHYIIVFKSKLNPGVEADYDKRVAEIYKLASAMPGMLSTEDYTGADGARVSLIEFDTLEHLLAWRDHEEHKVAQQEGRDRWYASYSITITQVQRSSSYDAATKTWTKLP